MIDNTMKIKQSQGLALPVILLLLLVMTILGVTSLSSSTLQERMAAGQRLREVAFNFAETTLREGELHVELIAKDIRKRESLSFQSSNDPDFSFFGEDDPLTNPFWEFGFPSLDPNSPNLGDSCTGGYCTPLEFDNSATPATVERWLDATVWADAKRHRVLESFTAAQLAQQDMAEAPKYIIEFLGQHPLQDEIGGPSTAKTKCTDNPGAPNDSYPYCIRDPYFFRITARSVAGIGGRTSVVMLQSTVIVEQL